MLPRSTNTIMRSGKVALVLVFTLLATGCLTTKSYVDPTLPDVKYTDLTRRSPGEKIAVNVEFQTNGKPKPEVSKAVLDKLVLTLRATGVFADVITQADPANDRLDVVMNNVADMGKAVGKGIGTGLTFGLAGSLVTDGYEFKATYRPVGKDPVVRNYKHAIHTTVGNKKGPPGLQPVPVGQAFDMVVEDLVLNLLRDLQKDGYLVDPKAPAPATTQ